MVGFILVESMETLQAPLFDTQISTAPAANQEALRSIESSLGFLPNMFATMGRSEAVLQGYLALDTQYAKSGFTALERNVILLAASIANECGYCVPAHSTILKGFVKADAALVDAIKKGEPTADAKINALVDFTKELANNRGHISNESFEKFLAAGYTQVNALEVLVGLALKTITNYIGHIANVAVDPAFAPEA